MSKFLKFSLVSVLAIGTFSIAPTFAQEDGDVEEVIVTGSKIKKVDIFDSSKPLEVVDAAQIERTGLNNIGDVLQNLTYLMVQVFVLLLQQPMVVMDPMRFH